MKKGLFLMLLMAALFSASCNKSSTNGASDRSGLALLADPKADNYIVLAYHVGYTGTHDTLIMQNTNSDSSQYFSGKGQNLGGTYSEYLVNEMFAKNPASFKSISFEFDHLSGYVNPTLDCAWVDTFLRVGMTGTWTGVTGRPSVCMFLTPNSGVSSNTDRTTDSLFMNIQSITTLTTTTGCKKARVIGTIGNFVQFWNTVCGTSPTFVITDGAFQLDFQVQ